MSPVNAIVIRRGQAGGSVVLVAVVGVTMVGVTVLVVVLVVVLVEVAVLVGVVVVGAGTKVGVAVASVDGAPAGDWRGRVPTIDAVRASSVEHEPTDSAIASAPTTSTSTTTGVRRDDPIPLSLARRRSMRLVTVCP
jgi:hypothetical protein